MSNLPGTSVAGIEAARPMRLLVRLYTPSSIIAAVAAGVASFVDGVAYGDRPKHLDWYALDWDLLYYVERAFVFYVFIVAAILIATAPFVRAAWKAAYEAVAAQTRTSGERAQRSAPPPE
jgi:hypothetical protein